MRRNTSTSESSTIALPANESRSQGALVGALLLLAASFALLVLAPTLLSRFQSASQSMPVSGFLPLAAASGIALGGGAAMIAVVSRLVRDIEKFPFAGLAPVLAVFAGFVLWGLRAQLPLSGVPSEYAGVFGLMVSVAGGALVARPGAMARVAGWTLAFFGPATLLLLLWNGSGHAQLGAAMASLAPQTKMFLGLSSGAALAMVVLGEASRVLARNAHAGLAAAPRESLESYALPRHEPATRSAEPLFPAPALRRAAPAGARTGTHDAVLPMPSYDQAPRYQDDDVYVPDAPGPRVNVWELGDDELTLPKRFAWWKVLFVTLLLAGGAGAAVYYGMILPNRAKERAAAELMQQKRAQIAAEAQREQTAKQAVETKAAAARLEAMLAAPAAAAPAAAETQPAPEQPAQVAAPAAAAPAAVPTATPAVQVEQLKPEAKRPARAARPRNEPTRSAPGTTGNGGLNDTGSDDPIYGL